MARASTTKGAALLISKPELVADLSEGQHRVLETCANQFRIAVTLRHARAEPKNMCGQESYAANVGKPFCDAKQLACRLAVAHVESSFDAKNQRLPDGVVPQPKSRNRLQCTPGCTQSFRGPPLGEA